MAHVTVADAILVDPGLLAQRTVDAINSVAGADLDIVVVVPVRSSLWIAKPLFHLKDEFLSAITLLQPSANPCGVVCCERKCKLVDLHSNSHAIKCDSEVIIKHEVVAKRHRQLRPNRNKILGLKRDFDCCWLAKGVGARLSDVRNRDCSDLGALNDHAIYHLVDQILVLPVEHVGANLEARGRFLGGRIFYIANIDSNGGSISRYGNSQGIFA